MQYLSEVYFDNEKDQVNRIISIQEDCCYVINMKKRNAMPFKIEREIMNQNFVIGLYTEMEDPFNLPYTDDGIPKKTLDQRNLDWIFVTEWCIPKMSELLKKQTRGKCISYIAEQSGYNVAKIKALLSRYWQRGMIKNALLPDWLYSGGSGKEKKGTKKSGRKRNIDLSGIQSSGIIITDVVKNQIISAYKKYYLSANKFTILDTYNLFLRDFYSDHVISKKNEYKLKTENQRPSYSQFRYYFEKIRDQNQEISLRESSKKYELTNRELTANSQSETFGIGSRFQIDATIADVYLVSSLHRDKPIGRPVVYGVIDVYSRMITGLYVGLEGPSALGATGALANMISNKVEFCKEFGIIISEEDWPCNHIPAIIIADRGEFMGHFPEGIINNFNITIENTRPYRGDMKGIVERKFGTINGKIKRQLPGAIMKEYRERGDVDYRLKANLDLHAFTEVMIELVLENNRMIMSKYETSRDMRVNEVVPRPIDLWNYSIKAGTSQLRKADKKGFLLSLLPKAKGTVTRKGIKFTGLHYTSKLSIKEQWFVKKKRKIDIIYDPRNMKNIYIPLKNNDYEICYLISDQAQYGQDFFEEIAYSSELENELIREGRKKEPEINVNTMERIAKIVKKAENQKKNTINVNGKISKSKTLKNIRKNRSEEKAFNRNIEAFNLENDDDLKRGQGKVLSYFNKKEVVAKDDYLLNILEKIQNEDKGNDENE